MLKRDRILLIIPLVSLLILVRYFGQKLFYDPFINYFESDYLTVVFPDFNMLKLYFYLTIRYVINMIISLNIIFLIFRKEDVINFTLKFYIIAFIVLGLVYFVELRMEFFNGYIFAFYVRRMLIHPLFLLILLPALYYQKLSRY
jgi:exosortase F-associated protein